MSTGEIQDAAQAVRTEHLSKLTEIGVHEALVNAVEVGNYLDAVAAKKMLESRFITPETTAPLTIPSSWSSIK